MNDESATPAAALPREGEAGLSDHETSSTRVPLESDLLAGDDPRVVDLLGPAHGAIVTYAEMLADEGVKRGLIGPREVPRLWERHLVNSAAVAAFLPADGTVIDVGTGAGLPGVVLAAMRPDLRIVLLEPMERRVAWLLEVVDALGLTNAEVLRGRAEELHRKFQGDAVTARAVAPMERLAGWTLPLLRAGGVLLAMKGEHAGEELDAAAAVIRSHGGGPGEILTAPTVEGLPPTTVVRVTLELVMPGNRPLVTRAKDTARRRPKRGGGRREQTR